VKAPQSGSRKRSSGHTKLEDEFWRAFREIAAKEGCSAAELATRVLYTRTDKNLSSALRVFVLEHFRASPGDAG
jgi:predicted DNA-binding ribbon-helix-helix protein